MGATDYIIGYRESDQAKVIKLWERQIETDECESGRGTYAGNATTMHGQIKFHDERFSTESEARNWILDQHEKWSGPIGASFYLPVEKTERDKQREAKAAEAYTKLCEKAKQIVVKANNAFRERKSKMIGCSNCGSKLSKEHYHKNESVHAILHVQREGHLNTVACSVCKAPLISETALKQILAYEPKIKAANEVSIDAHKPKAGKQIGWCVGGWAAT